MNNNYEFFVHTVRCRRRGDRYHSNICLNSIKEIIQCLERINNPYYIFAGYEIYIDYYKISNNISILDKSVEMHNNILGFEN